MSWFNFYGLAIVAVILAPNIFYAIKHENDVANVYKNKAVVLTEQIGRYGCIIFMIFNVPYTYLNFWFHYALIIYLSINGILCLIYLLFWTIYWNKTGKIKALSLSILPSCIFLFSGITLANIPLIIFAVLFSANHILISYKNSLKVH